MKQSWYSEMMKVARRADLSLGEVVIVRRTCGVAKMRERMAKSEKVFEGQPVPLCPHFATVPVYSKRTGVFLYSLMRVVA